MLAGLSLCTFGLDFPVFAAEAGAAASFFGTVRRRLVLLLPLFIRLTLSCSSAREAWQTFRES